MAKRHISLFLILFASRVFAQSRVQTGNLKPQASRICPCGKRSSEEELLTKLNALSSASRNAAITLIESLYQQEQEKLKKRLKVFHKKEEK